MNEIKFRQWIDGWHYWGFIDDKFIPPAEMEDMEVAKKYSYQYTKLKDKNGKEIYEGDIVIQSYLGRATDKQVVVFDNGAFRAISVKDEEKLGLEKIEVIGNIYENLELLK